jgi:hypothetical protein
MVGVVDDKDADVDDEAAEGDEPRISRKPNSLLSRARIGKTPRKDSGRAKVMMMGLRNDPKNRASTR